MDKVGFSDFLLCWRPVSPERAADRTPIALRAQFGCRPEREAVKTVAHEVLERRPASLKALELLELLTPRSHRHELRERYEAFLFAAPFHREAARVREDLIDLLLERRLYGEAARHIAALRRARAHGLPSDEVTRVRSVVPPEHEPPDPNDGYEELDELDLEPCEDWEWSAFARVKASE
jgi:hypothetical protein